MEPKVAFLLVESMKISFYNLVSKELELKANVVNIAYKIRLNLFELGMVKIFLCFQEDSTKKEAGKIYEVSGVGASNSVVLNVYLNYFINLP